MSEERHPLVYMWIAVYKDGQTLPQFDFESGKENSLRNVVMEKVKKFMLIPFSDELSSKVNVAGDAVVLPLELSPFILNLHDNERLIYFRRNAIHDYTYQICTKCGNEWQWMPDVPKEHDGDIGDVGLAICSNQIVENVGGTNIPSALCPKCNSYNPLTCVECKEILWEHKEPDNSRWYDCPKCHKKFEHPIFVSGNRKRVILYVIGYQLTIKNVNKKFLVYVHEDGTFDLGED